MTRKPDPEKLVKVTHQLTERQLSALDRLAIELYSDRSKLIRRAVDMLIEKEGKK
jgi:metal-responsive CopG/Arc/MetJ family transcriptional regulator